MDVWVIKNRCRRPSEPRKRHRSPEDGAGEVSSGETDSRPDKTGTSQPGDEWKVSARGALSAHALFTT